MDQMHDAKACPALGTQRAQSEICKPAVPAPSRPASVQAAGLKWASSSSSSVHELRCPWVPVGRGKAAPIPAFALMDFLSQVLS